MKKTLLTIAAVLTGLLSFAQTGGYAFMTYETEYQSLIPGTGTTILTNSYTGFDPGSYFTNVPIGFRFRFGDSSYTHINIAPDGYVWFGDAPAAVNMNGERTKPVTTDLQLGIVFSALGMLSHESQLQGAAPAIAYHTWGKAPFRVFTVEWKDNATFDNLGEERLSFQIMLHETYNNIEFVYDSMAIVHANADTVEVGIRGYLNDDFSLLENAGIRPWDSLQSTGEGNKFCVLRNDLAPKKGLTHIFFNPSAYVAVVTPNEGETFQPGDQIDVEFASAVLTGDRFAIWFSSDSGATYTALATDTLPATSGAGRKFSFTAPNISSSKCFVKVTSPYAFAFDSNDVPFIITQTPTGVLNPEVKTLSVYPNPANDRISFSGEGLSFHAQAEIYDITGRMLSSEKVNTTIDVSGLTEGYYLLRVTDGEQLFTGRFFINR